MGPHSITFQEQEEALMDNKGKLHEWSNKRKNVDRYISMFDTVVASTLTECQDDPTHDLSLALNGQVQVSGIVSGVNTRKGNAEHKHSSRATNPFPTDYDPNGSIAYLKTNTESSNLLASGNI